MRKPLTLVALLLGFPAASRAVLTWSFQGAIPVDKQAMIRAAMDTAVSNYNAFARYNGKVFVTYNSGVPTAQTDGYQGLIEFGDAISARVAQHELGHWMGCGTFGEWNNHRSNGRWTGTNAITRLKTYDGPGAILYCDTQHFWPYGWNYDDEGPADRNIGMVGALRRDMGLSDGTVTIKDSH